jgi:hypothetical protein
MVPKLQVRADVGDVADVQTVEPASSGDHVQTAWGFEVKRLMALGDGIVRGMLGLLGSWLAHEEVCDTGMVLWWGEQSVGLILHNAQAVDM